MLTCPKSTHDMQNFACDKNAPQHHLHYMYTCTVCTLTYPWGLPVSVICCVWPIWPIRVYQEYSALVIVRVAFFVHHDCTSIADQHRLFEFQTHNWCITHLVTVPDCTILVLIIRAQFFKVKLLISWGHKMSQFTALHVCGRVSNNYFTLWASPVSKYITMARTCMYTYITCN